MGEPAKGRVVAVHRDDRHRFSKRSANSIEVIAGAGVRGDAHAGATVQHLSRVRADPEQPNFRQVHLMHQELFVELAASGYDVRPGDLGENITTSGIDLLALGRDTLLRIGEEAVLSVTGLRNPCKQIENFASGLLREVAVKTHQGVVRKTGIMTIVLHGGIIRPNDIVRVEPPEGRFVPLEVV